MDTRYSRNTLPQSQNSSQNSTPHLGSHSHSYGDASSASLLRNHEHGQYEYSKSQQLKRPKLGVSFCVEIVVLCFQVLGFSAFAVLAFWMKGHPTGTRQGDWIEQAMKIGSTLYTTIFAAVLAAALKNIGRWRAQRGTSLVTVWTLMNTSTVSDPVRHFFTKPFRWNPLVLSLLGIWALSPLGSQSTLRLVRNHNSTSISDHGIRYWDSGPLGNIFPFVWSCVANDGGYPVSMRDMYLAALMQGLDAKQGPQDQWGNVKIPRLPDLSSSEAGPGGWYSVPKGPVNPEQYSSLSGIAVVGLDDLGKKGINFTVETAYVDLSCQDMVFRSGLSMEDQFNVTCQDCGQVCLQEVGGRIGAFLGSPFSGLTAAEQANSSFTKPRTILFQSTPFQVSDKGVGIVQAACQVTQRLVETWVECVGNDCTATKIRPSTKDHRSANYTSIDYWGGLALDLISRSTAPDLSPTISGGYILKGPSTAERFLNDSNVIPTPSTQQLLADGGSFDLSSVSIDVFATRASTLLNTALQVFMCPSCYSGNFPSNLSLYGPDHTPADGLIVAAKAFNWTIDDDFQGGTDLINDNIPFMAASTNATVTSYTEVYEPVYPWIGALLGSVAVVFLLGLLGICLRCATTAPNVFDPVIGLTYSNKYMPSTCQEGILDSEDRVKSAYKKRVRLGAVEHKEMMARVVFGEEELVSRLNKQTWYYEST